MDGCTGIFQCKFCLQQYSSGVAKNDQVLNPKIGSREGVGTARKPIFGGHRSDLPPPFNPPLEEQSIDAPMEISGAVPFWLSPKHRPDLLT